MGWLHMLAGGCGTVFITNNPDTHQTIPTIPTHCAPRVTIADLRPKTFYISKLGQNTFINSAATNSTTGGPHVNHGHCRLLSCATGLFQMTIYPANAKRQTQMITNNRTTIIVGTRNATEVHLSIRSRRQACSRFQWKRTKMTQCA